MVNTQQLGKILLVKLDRARPPVKRFLVPEKNVYCETVLHEVGKPKIRVKSKHNPHEICLSLKILDPLICKVRTPKGHGF
jgi:hypothetical protein